MDARRAWDENAPAWIELSRAGYDVYRDLLNTPSFLSMLPDVAGLAGLDLGCGEAHNTRLVADRGARLTALDGSPRFVRAAREEERRRPRGMAALVGDGAALPFQDGAFDFVVAFMSLMDMPDANRVLAEVARVLRPGGFLQFSISHPFSTTPVRRWIEDEEGTRTALAVGGYFDQQPFTESWLFGAAPEDVRARHRPFLVPRFPLTLAGWLNAVAGAGLVVEHAAEPYADEDLAAAHPVVADTRIVPYFLHLRVRKPGRAL